MRSWLALVVGFAVGGAACGRAPGARIDIRGSDSEVNLVQRLAETFMELNPDAFVAVTGGGSGVGIASLIDGTCDLANSSRPMNAEEKLLALRSGVEPHLEVFASDALTLVVNESNPIDVLDLDTIGALFRGEITSWAQVRPGPDAKVVAYGRQSSSGTYSWFRSEVVKGEYHPSTRQMTGTSQIVEAVARDPGGIGYVAVGYLKSGVGGVRALRVRRTKDGPVVDPLSDEAVMSGAYPIARPLYQFSNGRAEGALAEFMAMERSPVGRRIILSMGFFPPIPDRAGPAAEGEP